MKVVQEEPQKPEVVEESYRQCYADTAHNYVQVSGASKDKAFCTRCGHVIELE